ncbi:MAG: hypothetical protein LBV79_08240 [Candidatus Adiutrix sp.]|jgi:hypothetical protein|nr:hypothetical protein [Candidatus Adiutrix sp.]
MTDNINAATAEKEKPKSRVQEKPLPRQALMYVGPNRPYELPLMRNQVIKGSAPPPFCAELAKGKPHFAACFIRIQEAGTALAALRDPKSDISRAAAKIADETAAQLKAAQGGQ